MVLWIIAAVVALVLLVLILVIFVRVAGMTPPKPEPGRIYGCEDEE